MNATLNTARLTRMGLLAEPAGYVDGMNLYEFVTSNPTNLLDPLGFSSLTVDGREWRPPSVVDPEHPHVPRSGTAGPGVPLDGDLGRDSRSSDLRYKWFPVHNVVLDTKTGRNEQAPAHYPKKFKKQLQNKKAGARA